MSSISPQLDDAAAFFVTLFFFSFFFNSPLYLPRHIITISLPPLFSNFPPLASLSLFLVLQSLCQVFDMGVYQEKIRAYSVLPPHRNVAGITDIILGERKAYVFLDKDFGDMHTLVKSCRRLDEEQARRLFRQVVLAVAHCHQAGIVLGDLKLRKFVFADEKR